MTRHTLVSGLTVLAFGAIAIACKAGGVGDPCIPNDEFSATYGGASESGAQIEDRSFQCETRVCLIKHFRGRVTCPFGNPAGGSLYSGSDKDCLVPGTSEVVGAAVSPQCSSRKEQVYCSCRCAGEDSAANYCECPEDYECKEVTRSLDPTLIRPGDKYCVKNDDVVSDGYECAGLGCDEAPDKCGFSTNTYEF
jgi:hypothetical protein